MEAGTLPKKLKHGQTGQNYGSLDRRIKRSLNSKSYINRIEIRLPVLILMQQIKRLKIYQEKKNWINGAASLVFLD